MAIRSGVERELQEARGQLGPRISVRHGVLVSKDPVKFPEPYHLYHFKTNLVAYRGFPLAAPAKRSRVRELEYVRTRARELRSKYAGKWIVVEAGEVIEVGHQLPDLVASARSRGIPSPFVYFVPERDFELGL